MNPILALISPLTEAIKLGSEWLQGRRELKRAELEGQIAVTKAKTEAQVEYTRTQQAAEINWDLKSIENSGWKDEWFTLLLSIPMVMCFVPGGAEYVAAGFKALDESTPDWYQVAFLVAVGSAFGVKKLSELATRLRGK